MFSNYKGPDIFWQPLKNISVGRLCHLGSEMSWQDFITIILRVAFYPMCFHKQQISKVAPVHTAGITCFMAYQKQEKRIFFF